MTEEQTVKQACENILDFITHGNERHTLKPEDKVLILGDYGFLNPLYTQTLGNTIDDWQDNAGRVHVKFLPKKRPINQINPEITKLASTVQVVIGTYSNPGADITELESEIFHKAFVTPVTSRKDSEDFHLYVVAARPTVNILKILANTEQIRKTDRLTRSVKSYLKKNAGNTMCIYSDNGESKIPSNLILRIPKKDNIFEDISQPQKHIMNIPSGEDYFEPEPRTTFGKLVMRKGSYQHLGNPIQGRINLTISNGEIRDFEDVKGKDPKILGYLKRQLDNLANRYIAEIGIGTNVGSTEIPWEEKVYNRIILEKTLGYHIAYGDSESIGGTHKADIHIDNLFTYGNVFIGNVALIKNGKLREKVLSFK